MSHFIRVDTIKKSCEKSYQAKKSIKIIIALCSKNNYFLFTIERNLTFVVLFKLGIFPFVN